VRGNIIALATALFFGVCAAAFLPAFMGGLFSRRMNRPAAIASVVTGLATSLFWTAFINAKTAGGLGLCKALFGRPSLLPSACSPTWAVVDPILVALPLSALVALVVCRATRPMPRAHVDYVFGGPKPTD
jgi:SSS family solute:Na+ symporter